MKILLAEDDKTMLFMLENILKRSGHTVESAANGAMALEKARSAAPDLMMPEMDGFMLCKRVKAEPALKNIPVILYTATRSGRDEEELAKKMGAVKLVLKTGGMEQLLAAIEEAADLNSGKGCPVQEPRGGQDVTEEYLGVLSRKLHDSERELRRERDLAKMYLDVAGVMLLALDRNGNISMVNKKGASMLGWGEGELLGKDWFATCLPPDMETEVRGVFKKLMAGDISPVEYYENPVRTRSGEIRSVAFQNSVIRDESSAITGVLFSGLDITEQRRAEEALLQAQKLDSIGLLSAGIAHDLNNLLGPILAYADFLSKSAPPGSAQQDDIREISLAAGRAAELVRQLMAFSRRQKMQLRVLNLNSVVQGLDGMLRRVLREHVKLVYSLDPLVGIVKVDPGQMEQVVVNLALNALEAMPEGGTLTISTGVKECPGGGGKRSCVLSVADTGCGMEPAVQRRIFEPFFTTKASGRGMGLGLSAVYGIVKQSGGEIYVESGPGKGSVFSICLPLAEAPAVAAAGPDPRTAGAVLVVEDDETMMRIAKRILAGSGYKVLEAVNGKEALRVLAENAAAVSLLLTDVVMPELDGVGLSKEVLAKYPGIRILCMSGYDDKQEELQAVLGDKVAYLQKPFSPDALLNKAGEVLGRK